MAVAALLGVGMLLSRVGDPEVFWDTVKNANWWFVALAFVLGMLTDVAFGITFLGNVPIRIPIWPSIELQSALSFSNLAVPVAADTAMQVRYLQRNGLDLPSAVATGGVLSSVSEIVVQLGLFFVALWLSPDSIEFGRIDTDQIAGHRAHRRVRDRGRRSRSSSASAGSAQAVLPPMVRAARSMWECDQVAEPARAARRRQRRRAVPLRGLVAGVSPRVRLERRLLDAARAQHRHLDDRVARPDPRRWHRGLGRRPRRACSPRSACRPPSARRPCSRTSSR